MKRVSLKHIADETGVSFQTISKVLNGKGSVAPETRQRIYEAAERLGYVPDMLARSMVTRRTCTIGVVAGDFRDYVLTQLVVGAEREARRQEHLVIVGNINPDASDAEEYVRLLLGRRVDGILLAAPQLEPQSDLGKLLKGSPVVAVHPLQGADLSVVMLDHIQTGYLPTQHLLGLGHRRIGTITGPWDRWITHRRLHGYREALAEAGIAEDPRIIVESDWEVEGGYQATRRLLEQDPSITAIFAQNDSMAVGALSALQQMGRRVPEECSVVGCDNIPVAAHTIPPLTTVHTPIYETGREAIRLLLNMITSETDEPQQIVQPVSLIRRASCAEKP